MMGGNHDRSVLLLDLQDFALPVLFRPISCPLSVDRKTWWQGARKRFTAERSTDPS